MSKVELKESLILSRELGVKQGIAECLDGLAGVGVVLGVPERSARLLGAAEELREIISSPLPPADRAEVDGYVAAVRDALDEEAFEAAWAEGRAMTIEEAIEYALDLPADKGG